MIGLPSHRGDVTGSEVLQRGVKTTDVQDVHTSKMLQDKSVSDARQVFAPGGGREEREKKKAQVKSDPRSLAHLRRRVSTL